jgi:oxaloacetate decarboxylase alpha subunit
VRTHIFDHFTLLYPLSRRVYRANSIRDRTLRILGITEVVLRDAHQSILATRLRIEDMLPICEKLDQIGYWSIESWGGATFDSCIRYLGEDPWERLRSLKAAMPNTPQQMLFRGQNILGYTLKTTSVMPKGLFVWVILLLFL